MFYFDPTLRRVELRQRGARNESETGSPRRNRKRDEASEQVSSREQGQAAARSPEAPREAQVHRSCSPRFDWSVVIQLGVVGAL